jgi:hypothetical protein
MGLMAGSCGRFTVHVEGCLWSWMIARADGWVDGLPARFERENAVNGWGVPGMVGDGKGLNNGGRWSKDKSVAKAAVDGF